MKKLTLALMCAISVILLATSCKKSNEITKDPTVKFVKEAGYAYQDTTVYAEDTIMIKFDCVAQDEKDLLKEFDIEVTSTSQYVEPTQAYNEALSLVKTYSNTYKICAYNVGVYTIKLTVKTESGRTATASIKVTSEKPTSGEADFEWYRQGGKPGLGLEMLGLKWTSNYKEVCAKIVANNPEYDELRRLDGVNYDEIVDVVTAFNEGTKIDEFHEISCEKPSATYDYVIATHSLKFAGADRDVYFVMHVTNSTVTTDPTLGTTVTITGRYKWVKVK